ncbi:uncharacterized protein LOC134266452 [Saccostrea cucullata]|uniref:uncharacterized protein LOC134266452 n=1 Tax=Saccostrea cuccullata TaxID=36930 RepID=UPI002ED0202F
MPSGTTVNVLIRNWPPTKLQLDITIIPTISDKYNSSGLCGNFDGNKSNDFTRSTGEEDTVIEGNHQPSDFLKSWSFKYNLTESSLFTRDTDLFDKLKSINETNIRLCDCTNTGKIDCSYDESVRCRNLNRTKVPCRSSATNDKKRTKRNARSEDVSVKHEIVKRNSFMVSRGEAEEICFSAFSRSTMYQTCQNKVAEFTNSSLSNCVLDVMWTGDENITQLHLDAANQECTIIASQNVTLQSSEPELVTELEMQCLNNCSEKGICNGGNCTCDEGFAGTDCSFDRYAPPDLFSSLDEQVCDLSREDCSYGSVHGEYFFQNSETLCYINRTTILPNYTKIMDFLKINLVVQTV